MNGAMRGIEPSLSGSRPDVLPLHQHRRSNHEHFTMNQRGFGTFAIYIMLGLGAALAVSLIALKIQSARLESEKAEHQATQAKFDAFVIDTKRLGLEAQKKADEQKAKDKLAKEKADAQNRADRDRIAVLTRGLREYRASAGRDILPAPKAGAGSPDTITFDRAALGRALQEFVDATTGFAIEGSQAVIDLDTAKRWAQER